MKGLMSRFYFHLLEPPGLVKDEHGTELHDLGQARQEAVKGIRDILAEAIRSGRGNSPGALIIADEWGSM
jgi:hypothetical protein